MMELEHQSVAKEERITIDRLADTVFASQIPVSTVLNPVIGWALLSLVILDTVGNLLGIPVVTGSLLGGKSEASVGSVFILFALQLGVFCVAGAVLFRSPARFWLLASSEDDHGEAAWAGAGEQVKDRFVSLMGVVSKQTKKIREIGDVKTEPPAAVQAEPSPSEGTAEGVKPDHGARRRRMIVALRVLVLVLTVAGSAALVVWFLRSAILLFLIGVGVFLLGDMAIALFNKLYPKVRSDVASSLGVLAGTGVAVVVSLLVGAEHGLFTQYPYQTWVKGELFSFRVLEYFFLCGIIFSFGLVSSRSLKYSVFYRVNAPAGGPGNTYYVFDFASLSAWPAYVQLDPNTLGKVVVLARRSDKHYEILDHSERLPLLGRTFTVLNLAALQCRIGEATALFRDTGDIFVTWTRYMVLAHSFEALRASLVEKLGNILPDRAVGLLLEDLFKSQNPRGFLDKLLTEALNEYAGEQQASARDLHEGYLAVLGRAREATAFGSEQLSVPANLASGESAALQMCIVGYQQLRASREKMHDLLNEPRLRWQQYRQKRLKAKEELPRLFQKRLRDHFVSALTEGRTTEETDGLLEATVSCLLECSSIHVVVESFDFAEGPAQECENMLATIDREDAARREQIDSSIKQREAQLIEFAMGQVAQGAAARREVIGIMVQRAPEVLPFLLQHPAGSRFIRMLMNLGEEAMASKLAAVKQLKTDDPQWAEKVDLLTHDEAAAASAAAKAPETTF